MLSKKQKLTKSKALRVEIAELMDFEALVMRILDKTCKLIKADAGSKYICL